MILSLLRSLLALKNFKKGDEIISFVKDMSNLDNLNKGKHVLFQESSSMNLWLVAGEKYIYVVRDKGNGNVSVILKRKKEDFLFNITRENNEPRLYIKDTTTSLPISTNITGGTESFIETLTELKTH